VLVLDGFANLPQDWSWRLHQFTNEYVRDMKLAARSGSPNAGTTV